MISIKTKEEIEIIAEGGKILGQILATLCEMAEKGNISTMDLENKAVELIADADATPSFKNYHDYPAALCTSINEEIVHGIPSESRVLKSGDIIGIDIGMKYKGLYTDMAYTVIVGDIDDKARAVRSATKDSLRIGIEQIKPGNHIGDIGNAIEKYVEENNLNYGIVRQMTGHGVGYKVHEDPLIPNYGKAGSGEEIKVGMVFAIEPMLTTGDWRVETLDDDWTTVTADGSLSAHFEKTVVVTENGVRELTPFIYDK